MHFTYPHNEPVDINRLTAWFRENVTPNVMAQNHHGMHRIRMTTAQIDSFKGEFTPVMRKYLDEGVISCSFKGIPVIERGERA